MSISNLKAADCCPWGRKLVDLSNQPLKAAEKLWIVKQIVDGRSSATKMAERYNLRQGTIRRWVHSFRNDHLFSEHGKRGRAQVLTDEKKMEFKDAVEAYRRHTGMDMAETAYTHLIQQKAIESSQIRANITPAQVGKVSRRTRQRLDTELDIHNAMPDVTTNARAEAVADVRNCVSFAAAQALMVPRIKFQLILNADATAFTIKDRVQSEKRVVYSGKRSEL